MLRNIFIELLEYYKVNSDKAIQLWEEIEAKHSESTRHYHSLNHLLDLYKQLSTIKESIEDWHVILFTLFYHDIIYNARKTNNEEKSAELARKRMEQVGVPEVDIQCCVNQILATKSHGISLDSDTNLFTDADLSILGREWEVYDTYCKNVRKEYAIYPMLIYKQGRKKVIKHFLAMDKIYKTKVFFDKYEKQARTNLSQELKNLNG